MMHVPRIQSMTNGETIMASAEIAAPPERIFTALVTREVQQWWGSADTYRMADWSADLRVGGLWTVVVRTADDRSLPAGGEFLEIEAPSRIVQTRAYAWDHPTLGRRQTTVAWLLQPMQSLRSLQLFQDRMVYIADKGHPQIGGRLTLAQFLASPHLRTFGPSLSTTNRVIDEALDRLALLDARAARVVECRFFGGLSIEETAAALDISPITVKRDWLAAKTWLRRAITG